MREREGEGEGVKVPSELLGQHEYSPTSAGVASVSMNQPSVVFAI